MLPASTASTDNLEDLTSRNFEALTGNFEPKQETPPDDDAHQYHSARHSRLSAIMPIAPASQSTLPLSSMQASNVGASRWRKVLKSSPTPHFSFVLIFDVKSLGQDPIPLPHCRWCSIQDNHPCVGSRVRTQKHVDSIAGASNHVKSTATSGPWRQTNTRAILSFASVMIARRSLEDKLCRFPCPFVDRNCLVWRTGPSSGHVPD